MARKPTKTRRVAKPAPKRPALEKAMKNKNVDKPIRKDVPAVDVTIMANANLQPGQTLQIATKSHGMGKPSIHPTPILPNTSQVVPLRPGETIELRITDADGNGTVEA